MSGDARIEPYRDAQREQVVDLLALAYRANPIQVAVFGEREPDCSRQRRALFAASLPALLGGTKLVALDEARVVGFAHWVSHPGCRPTDAVLATVAPTLLASLEPDVATRVLTWRQAWGERDPEHAHSHFGPFVVHPDVQGRGIGGQMLARYCAELDRGDETGYLETERPENVRRYRKVGFRLRSELDVLGVRCWFMVRPGPLRVR